MTADPAAGEASVRLRALLAELARVPEDEAADGGDAEAWLRSLRPGAAIGRFELVRELGRGGFGVVWEARDRELGRLVAFKAVRPGGRSSSELREQWLLREAEAAAQLNHPNIVTLHDVGRGESGPYLILELLHGETLAQRLERGPLSVDETLRIGLQVARGLAHAHAAGVVHRDLKPSNVFVTEAGVKVLDFGLAHVFGGAGPRAGGTPLYMAPEQWRGEEEDERADVFALGAILHECLSGERPFRLVDGRSSALDPGPAPALAAPAVPAAVAETVAAMLAKDPAARPRNGRAALALLERAARSLAPAAPRRPAWRGAVALVALALAAGLAWAAARLLPAADAHRVALAVADVRNETGDAELDGLSGMLITSLEQSRRLAVLTRSRMLDLGAQVTGERPERLVDPVVREVARRAGAGVAEATVRRLGAHYVVDLQVSEPGRSDYVFAAREEAGAKEQLPEALDRLSARVRAGFRERSRDIEASRVRLADATTSNLAAWDHYFRGEQLFEMEQASSDPAWSAARQEWRKAVALAPDFAMAYYRIAYTLEHEGLDARPTLAKAIALLDRLPPKDRAYVEALQAHLDGRIDDAKRLYRRIVDEYPDEKEAWFALSQLSARRESGYDHAHAVEYAERALALDPAYAPAWDQLVISRYALGDDAGLLRDAERYAAAITSVSAWETLGYAQLVAGRAADAEATFRKMAAVMPGSPAGLLGVGTVRLAALDVAGAEAAYRRLAADKDPRRAREGRYGLSWASAWRGRYREAGARLDDVLRIDEALRDRPDAARAYGFKLLWEALRTGRFPERLLRRGLADVLPGGEPYVKERHLYWFAIWAALRLGDVPRAAALERESDEIGLNHTYQVVDMALARAAGRPDEARAIAAKLYSPRDVSNGVALDLAEWALREERYDEAVARATECLRMPTFPPHPDVDGFRAALWPRALLVRARAEAARGDAGAARADVDRLLALWRSADPRAPDVAAARALAATLRGRGGR